MLQTFDVLPNLIDVLKDIQSAASHQETTRIGDISASVRYNGSVIALGLLTSVPLN